MNTKELMLGNFLHHLDEFIIVKGISEDGVVLFNGETNKGYWNDKNTPCKPIQLTEEWLEKFGLIKKYLENPFEDGGYDLDEKGNKWYHWADNGTFNLEIQPNGEIWFEIYSCYRHIQYVHELQNLYFSLRGKELSIK